jgi:hypothetical protein
MQASSVLDICSMKGQMAWHLRRETQPHLADKSLDVPCHCDPSSQEEAKRSFIAATAVASMVACFLMGVLANMPLALAPGMVSSRVEASTQHQFSG